MAKKRVPRGTPAPIRITPIAEAAVGDTVLCPTCGYPGTRGLIRAGSQSSGKPPDDVHTIDHPYTDADGKAVEGWFSPHTFTSWPPSDTQKETTDGTK